MKYRVLLSTLRFLVLLKRGVWWLGGRIGLGLGKIWLSFWGVAGILTYKIGYFFRRLGFGRAREWFTKRTVFQLVVFVFLFIVSWSHTKLPAGKDLILANQKTLVYRLFAPSEEFGVEEVVADDRIFFDTQVTARDEAFNVGASHATGITVMPERDAATVVAGGVAFTKPILIPGTEQSRSTRTRVVEYIVEPGDSIGTIAEDFGVSVATIMWENNLTARSIIRPGNTLLIPPTTGVMYVVKRGDTVQKIATTFKANQEEIIAFNDLEGGGLKAGIKIMVPNGTKPNAVVAVASRPTITRPVGARVAAPPNSTSAPSASGFVWPSGSRTITQYFSWRHTALDIGGPWQTPTYAAKAGIVEKAQCGWNGGYGCYVIINHGGGIKTLYAHHAQLLVTPGESVEQGQTIALMGNSGNVRGVTGIHLHFEVIVNGVRVNALGYVRP